MADKTHGIPNWRDPCTFAVSVDSITEIHDAMSLELKRFLLNCYPTFANREAKDFAKAYSFRIDDLKEFREGSMPCHIYVEVRGLDRILLNLTDLPMNHEIEELVKSKGGEIRTEHAHCCVSLTLETADSQFILQLSELVRATDGPTTRDSHQDNHWICPRIAGSLCRFAALLRQYEMQTRGIEKTRPDGLFAF